MKPPDLPQLQLVGVAEPRTARNAEELHALAVVKLQREVLPTIVAAIARVTMKECAVLFNARPSHVSDAIAGRDRAFDVEWLVALLLAAPDAERLEILTTLCDVAGYRAPERKRKLSPADENTAIRRALQKLAPGLIAAIEQEVDNS